MRPLAATMKCVVAPRQRFSECACTEQVPLPWPWWAGCAIEPAAKVWYGANHERGA